MSNSNLAIVENQEPSELTIYSSGKFQRMYAKTINPYAALLVERMIEACTRVELSQNIYWFYADDSEKVIFAIRQSDNLAHLALSDIGFDAKYWYKSYYNLGKRLVSHLVAGVEAKMALNTVAPVIEAPAPLPIFTIVEKPRVCPSALHEPRLSFTGSNGHKFDVLRYDNESHVFQSTVSAVSYCMEIKKSYEDGQLILSGYINQRLISVNKPRISVYYAMRYSAMGYVASEQQAIDCGYEHLQSLVLSGKA